MTVHDSDLDDLDDLGTGETHEEKTTGPRIRTFTDGLTPAERAEAILDTIIKAKGGARREGQVQMARAVATAFSEQKPLLVQGGTGIGKALDIDTPIPTPHGFVRMGDLKAGDEVFNEEGLIVKVTHAFAYLHGRDCYRITFSDGTEIIGDGGHLWTTETVSSMVANAAWEGATTLTTLEIAQTIRNSTGRAKHRIPTALPLKTKHADLPVNPYRLGVWIAGLNTRGDASYAKGENLAMKTLRIETLDGTIVKSGDMTEADKHRRVRIILTNGERQHIDALFAERVHLPEVYLFASKKQRLALMEGMLDVSGHVVGNNQVRFQDHRKQVADDFLILASSLGYRASLAKRKDCQNVWVVSFSTPDSVFRVDHKNARIATEVRTIATRRTIVSVEKVESRTVRCITVDSPRHLFLAGHSMVPTHNSIAYLAGALASGRQTVVAPHTKALQDQLRADLELIASAFPPGEKSIIPTPIYAIIKGRSSYLCLNKVKGGPTDEPPPPEETKSLLETSVEASISSPTSKLGREIKSLYEWADETDTGERSDLPFPTSAKAWENVSTTSGDCLGKACGFAKECFANIERNRAFFADIIVVNQAYLAAWMKTPQILPPTIGGALIDEAHEFNGVVADSFGSNVTPARIEHTVSRAMNALTKADAKERAEVGAQEARDAAESLSRKLVITDKWERTDMNLPGLCTPEIKTVRAKISRLHEQASAYISAPTEQDKAQRDNLLRELENLSTDLELILDGHTDEQVVWAEKGFNDKVGLRAARFDVSETIFDKLLYRIRSVAFTSATLTIAGNFSLTANNFGFDKGPWSGTVVESPFNYEKQGLIWMPEGMPEPGMGQKGVAYIAQVAKVAEETALAAGGRTLVLCTSKASVKAIHEHLTKALKGKKHKVLGQGIGDLSARELAKQFTEDPRAILIGTRTFWTGISIEGDTCAAVVIDKVPFPSPKEPIIKARSDKADRLHGSGSGFKTVSLAEACLTLVQGAGRLVRTVSDRGVIVLCDPRIHRDGQYMKFYAPGMVRSLPPFPMTRDKARVLGMLNEINATANDAVAALEIEEDEGE